jgi:hypothetical protein
MIRIWLEKKLRQFYQNLFACSNADALLAVTIGTLALPRSAITSYGMSLSLLK